MNFTGIQNTLLAKPLIVATPLIAAIALILSLVPANAATVDFSVLGPSLTELAGTVAMLVAAIIVGLLARVANKWFGLSIDEKNRAALHGAIQRGIGGVLERAVASASDRATIDVDNVTVARVANYVLANSPGAMQHFGLTADKLEELVKAQFGVAIAKHSSLSAQPSPHNLSTHQSQ